MKKRIIRILLFLILLSVIIFYIGKPKQVKKETAPEMTLINKSRELAGKFYNANDIIRKFANYKDCDLSSSCIEISNPVMEWYGTYNLDYPVSLSKWNLIKLTFKNENDSAGINIIGRYAKKEDPWWKNRLSLNLAIESNLFNVILDTGKQEEPVQLLSRTINTDNKGFQSINVIFDNQGKEFTFTDSSGSFSKKIVIMDFEKNLKNGIFPENKIYFGVFVAPLSQLTISELYLMPLF